MKVVYSLLFVCLVRQLEHENNFFFHLSPSDIVMWVERALKDDVFDDVICLPPIAVNWKTNEPSRRVLKQMRNLFDSIQQPGLPTFLLVCLLYKVTALFLNKKGQRVVRIYDVYAVFYDWLRCCSLNKRTNCFIKVLFKIRVLKEFKGSKMILFKPAWHGVIQF